MLKSRGAMSHACLKTAKTAAVILAVALLPLVGVLISSLLAQMLGCALDEGSRHACLFLGQDIGGLLYKLFVLGWLGLISLPVAAVALALLVASLVFRLILRLTEVRR